MRLLVVAFTFALGAMGCQKSESSGAQAGPVSSVAKSRTTTVKPGELDGGADQVMHLDRYTTGARQLVQSAQKLADARHHKRVTSLHLLERILELKPVQQQFVDVKADPVQALTMANEALATDGTDLHRALLLEPRRALGLAARRARSGDAAGRSLGSDQCLYSA